MHCASYLPPHRSGKALNQCGDAGAVEAEEGEAAPKPMAKPAAKPNAKALLLPDVGQIYAREGQATVDPSGETRI